MRTLIVVPIIHTEQDMGSLITQIKREYIARFGHEKWCVRFAPAGLTSRNSGLRMSQQYQLQKPGQRRPAARSQVQLKLPSSLS